MAPDKAVTAIMSVEVPIALCMGYFRSSMSVKRNSIPPPAPKTPLMIPRRKPMAKETAISFSSTCEPLVASASTLLEVPEGMGSFHPIPSSKIQLR